MSAILQIGDNLSCIGFELENGKTNLLSFSYGKSKTENIVLDLTEDIRSSESAKLLELTFDYKMTWESQLITK